MKNNKKLSDAKITVHGKNIKFFLLPSFYLSLLPQIFNE